MAPHTVVILGGSYAGMHVAHYLLKYTRPNHKELKVVVVSQNSHLYWNCAAVRAIVPGTIPHEKLFGSLDTALSRYPAESHELVVGKAEHADFAARTVRVATAGGGSRTLAYDQLVVATGSHAAAPGVPWKAAGTHEEIVAQLQATQARVAAARSIVVAGAGATGVETAAELGYAFGPRSKAPAEGRKEITLLSAGPEILSGDSLAGGARAELAKLGVNVRTGVMVLDAATKPGAKTTEIRLEGGETVTADLYLPTMGLIPNTEYVDGRFKDDKGLMLVDEEFRVQGAERVWAVGDVVSKPRAAFLHTTTHAPNVAKNVEAVLKGKEPSKVKGMPFDILICATGPDRAVGRLGYVKVPSFVGWFAKGKTLALEFLPKYIDGSCA